MAGIGYRYSGFPIRKALTYFIQRKYSSQVLRCTSLSSKQQNKCFLREQKIQSFHTSIWQQKTVPFLLADIGEGIQEVVLKEWYVKEGDKVNQFDNICEVQSDKASVTITSRYDGIVEKLYYEVDGTAFVGKPLLDIEVEKEVSGTVGAEVQEREAIAVGTQEDESSERSIELPSTEFKVLTTPAVRRLAMEHKVDLTEVNGTGKDGRILKEDLLYFIEKRDTAPQRTFLKSEITPPPPQKEQKLGAPIKKSPPKVLGKDTTESIKGYRKAMVKTMTASMKIPHFGYSDEVNLTKLVELRPEISAQLEHYNLKFSYMLFFIKAASLALQSFPILNSSVDDNCETITYKASHNIGFAMDTAEGLVVPNIKAVQELTLLQVTEELSRLVECGRKGSFATSDISGGTFTISNIGSIGGTYTKPVILPPQVAIGAVGKTQRLPRFNSSGNVEAAHIMNVSWSADHRVIDGATMARFSNVWKGFLERPATMVLYLK